MFPTSRQVMLPACSFAAESHFPLASCSTKYKLEALEAFVALFKKLQCLSTTGSFLRESICSTKVFYSLLLFRVIFNRIKRQYGIVANLGQGFPDFSAPEHVRAALAEAANGQDHVEINQYTREFGHLRLVRALATLLNDITHLNLNPETQLLIASGASQSLFEAFMALIIPEDEVIIFEPFFDCYEPMVRMAGGRPIFVPLIPKTASSGSTSADWVLDMAQLEAAFSKRTKMIVLNTPHNPTGKVFTRIELEAIGALATKYNVIILADEVYEWITFSGAEHIRIATLPGLFERTITVGSAGKTFSITGWKIGWSYGPVGLMEPLFKFHQTCVYSCNSPAQEAIAVGFEVEYQKLRTKASYWKQLVESLEPKRDRLKQMLEKVGMLPTVPEGGYFMLANIEKIAEKIDLSEETGSKDYRFAKWLAKTMKLQSIPLSAFYSEPHKKHGENYIRFCFIKTDETLDKAEAIIEELKKLV